jgi:hypothetical protein
MRRLAGLMARVLILGGLGLAALAGCARITAVDPGPVAIGAGLHIRGEVGWNRLPPGALGADQAWTRDGSDLDTLLFVAGRSEGQPLLTHKRERKALLLHAGVTPTEVMELWGTELALAGHCMVRTDRLMPAAFASSPGFGFHFAYANRAGLPFEGYAASAMVGQKLYLIAFAAARAHQFPAYWPAASVLIGSANIVRD